MSNFNASLNSIAAVAYQQGINAARNGEHQFLKDGEPDTEGYKAYESTRAIYQRLPNPDDYIVQAVGVWERSFRKGMEDGA